MTMESILNKIYNNIDDNKAVTATFVELSKAFNIGNHEIIRYIHRENRELIQSYSNRKQIVRTHHLISQTRNKDVGSPQGPLLFLFT